MTDISIPSVPKAQIHFGHLGVVLLVALLLLGFSWMKDPQLFSMYKTREAMTAITDPTAPRYYAYVQPAEYSEPLVAGASTIPQGPSIINEDGSISPALDVGEVLGVSTDDFNLNLNAIAVNQIFDSDEAAKKYLEAADGIEQNYMNNLEFEAAISSNNQQQIDGQLEKIKLIATELQKLSVPNSLADLHKNKILQYNAAVVILENYTKADENPQLVSQALGIFLQAQTQIENLTPPSVPTLEE